MVDANFALDVFSENRFKVKQIPNIAEKSKTGRFTSRSPYDLTASLGQLGRWMMGLDLKGYRQSKAIEVGWLFEGMSFC